MRQAAKNGMVHVFVGNTCPRIVVSDGMIAIGDAGAEEDRIPKGFDLDGSITTDTNWATLIDRKVLVEMVTKGGMPAYEAGDAVERYVGDHAQLLRVKPGLHRLTFTASEELAPLLPHDHPSLTNGFLPRLVLERLN